MIDEEILQTLAGATSAYLKDQGKELTSSELIGTMNLVTEVVMILESMRTKAPTPAAGRFANVMLKAYFQKYIELTEETPKLLID